MGDVFSVTFSKREKMNDNQNQKDEEDSVV